MNQVIPGAGPILSFTSNISAKKLYFLSIGSNDTDRTNHFEIISK
jgi:hypothetical protein